MLVVLIICIFLGLSCPGLAAVESQEVHPPYFTLAEWAFEVRGEGDYDPNPSGEFRRGERGYAYLEMRGFGIRERSDFFFSTLNVDVALETKNGFRLFSQKDVLELEELHVEQPVSTWFYIYVDIPWWAPKGVYKTLITVRDAISETSVEKTREILVY